MFGQRLKDAHTAVEYFLFTVDEWLWFRSGEGRLSLVVRSVNTARSVLAELPAEEQLAACRELVHEPKWRVVTCAQLVSLRADPSMKPAVDRFLDELAGSDSYGSFVSQVRRRGTAGEVIRVPNRSL